MQGAVFCTKYEHVLAVNALPWPVKGVLHPEMPDILYSIFYIKIFLQFKFQICAYTQLKSKNLK